MLAWHRPGPADVVIEHLEFESKLSKKVSRDANNTPCSNLLFPSSPFQVLGGGQKQAANASLDEMKLERHLKPQANLSGLLHICSNSS